MDKQEYLGFVAILQDIRAVLDDVTRPPTPDDGLLRVFSELDRAIETYREKANAAQP